MAGEVRERFCGIRQVRELLRCLQPGGLLLLSAWGGHEETAAFQVIPTAAEAVLSSEGRQASRPKRADGSPAALRSLLEVRE